MLFHGEEFNAFVSYKQFCCVLFIWSQMFFQVGGLSLSAIGTANFTPFTSRITFLGSKVCFWEDSSIFCCLLIAITHFLILDLLCHRPSIKHRSFMLTGLWLIQSFFLMVVLIVIFWQILSSFLPDKIQKTHIESIHFLYCICY